LADAIVAMSAESAGAVLVTSNKRHYPMIDELVVPYCRS
jgi:predicted nucleic acid-binding protein